MYTLTDTITWEQFQSFFTYEDAESSIKEVAEDLFLWYNLKLNLVVTYIPDYLDELYY